MGASVSSEGPVQYACEISPPKDGETGVWRNVHHAAELISGISMPGSPDPSIESMWALAPMPSTTDCIARQLQLGGYPWYKPPCNKRNPWNDDGTANIEPKKPRTYHLVVDLVYSALFGQLAAWSSSLTNSLECYWGDCSLNSVFLLLSMLFHWWRLNVTLVWYDVGQSIVADIFFVGDNICMLGIATIIKTAGVDDTTYPDVESLTLLFMLADCLLIAQQILAAYVNRESVFSLGSCKLFFAHFTPGFILRLVWLCLMYSNRLANHEPSEDGTPAYANKEGLEWMFYGSLLDFCTPWLYGLLNVVGNDKCAPTNCCLSTRGVLMHSKPLPLDITFLDARIGRIMIIVTSLLLTSELQGNWDKMSNSCRAQVLIYPALLVFSYLPYLVTFDRDPGTSRNAKYHAMNRGDWYQCLYWQTSVVVPALVVVIAGKLQRAMATECNTPSDPSKRFDTSDQWTLLQWHASMIAVLTIKMILHTGVPDCKCRWPRRYRVVLRLGVACLPLIANSIDDLSFNALFLVLIASNLLGFFLERFGRVERHELEEAAQMDAPEEATTHSISTKNPVAMTTAKVDEVDAKNNHSEVKLQTISH